MTSANAVRYLAREAARCHALALAGDPAAPDAHAMLCLVFPALLKVLELRPMEDDFEIKAFQFDFHESLKRQQERAARREEAGTLAHAAAEAG